MKSLKLFLALSVFALTAFAQCGKMVPNPITGAQDCVGSTPTGSVALKGNGTLDFSSIADGTCSTLTFTLTGALTTDYVATLRPTGLNANVTMNAWVSAADTITVQLCNNSGAANDPASATYGVALIR